MNLPNLPVIPVTESDSAGTNFVLEEWCIDEQPALWAAFAHAQETQSGGPTDGVAISATSPNSNWPGVQGGLDHQSTTQVASDIASNAGAIGAVQVKYADGQWFGGSDPTKNVALGEERQRRLHRPSPVDVASALAYATQLPNGTHQLNFNGAGPHVYNPSTYSYLLTPTTGWSPAKGATMSQFVNYALTLGQQTAPGVRLRQPGAVPRAVRCQCGAAQRARSGRADGGGTAAYACGDLTPSEVPAGQTTPTCGVTNRGARARQGRTPAPPPARRPRLRHTTAPAAAGAAGSHGVNGTGSSVVGRRGRGRRCRPVGGADGDDAPWPAPGCNAFPLVVARSGPLRGRVRRPSADPQAV